MQKKHTICLLKHKKKAQRQEALYLLLATANVLSHPQTLNLAERMERAVYLGLDEKNLTAKFVAGTKVL